MAGREEYIPFVALLVLVAFMLTLFAMLRRHLRDARQAKLQEELHTRLLDRFPDTQQLITFLESEPGRRLLGTQTDTVHERILFAVHTGCVLIFAGGGVSGLAALANQEWLLGIAIVLMFIGVGFLASAGLAWKIAGKWGLLRRR